MKAANLLLGVVMATTFAITLLSGKAIINFTHTPNVEHLIKSKVYTIKGDEHDIKIYLSSSIVGPDQYRKVFDVLFSAKEGDTVTFYLAGNGGRGDTLAQLIMAIKHTKAKVRAVVYGGVSSAHAILALNIKHIKVLDTSIPFLFHLGARGPNAVMGPKVCDGIDEKKTNRGQSTRNKCKKYVNARDVLLHYVGMVNVYAILTNKEVSDMEAGHDIILTGHEIINRLNNGVKK